jgi:nucleoside-diphosphate-sugar epimerase
VAVFVTGASGFLGGRLAELLAARGDEVVVLARTSADMRHLAHVPVRVVPGHLGELETLQHAMRGVTQIFHCAAASTDWASPQTFYEANVRGTENLLAAAETVIGLKRFVHVSTTDVYGYPPVPCSESHAPIDDLNDVGLGYNHTKVLGERAVWAAHRERGLPVTVIRPATIYGPRGKAFVTDFAELLRIRLMAYIDDGRRTGGFTYVDTVAEAMMQAAASERTLGMAYNLSDGTNGTWSDYVSGLASGLGYKPPWLNLSFGSAMLLARAMEFPHGTLHLPGRPQLTRHAVYLLGRDQEFPNEKARRHFGFAPTVDLAEGISRSVAWLKSL